MPRASCCDRRDDRSVRRRPRGRATSAPTRSGSASRPPGVCHSDVSVVNGTIPFPTPVVLGHEGAGVVERGRRRRQPASQVGDHVVLSTLGNCGACAACDRGKPTHCRTSLGKLSRPVHRRRRPKAFQFANTGVFAETTVVKGRQAVPIIEGRAAERRPRSSAAACSPASAPCSTGPRSTHGESALVHRRRAASASTSSRACALSDALPDHRRRHQPGQGGAGPRVRRHPLHRRRPTVDTAEAVKEICPNGVDFAFECVGHPALIRQSIDLLDWGGTAVHPRRARSSAPRPASSCSSMYNDKTIMGCRYGAARPHHDIPLLVELYQAGRLKLDELVTKTYPIGRRPADARRPARRRRSPAACSQIG